MAFDPNIKYKCPPPLLMEDNYPPEGGFVAGRFCAPLPNLSVNITCCLPCPQADWIYGSNFTQTTHIASYISIACFVGCIFLLLSFGVLPRKMTHGHYLTICLVVAVAIMQLGFIIPLAAHPEQCFNDITPNDMYSDLTCAFSGSFLIAGGWSGVMWVFLRALSIHLQICWRVVPGKKFFLGALVTGWGIPAIFVTTALVLTGVSYRFGDTCHINHEHSLQVFWTPLLVFTGAAILIQLGTFGYCVKVYLQSVIADSPSPSTTRSGTLPSYNGSERTMSPRQTYNRIQKVFELQWRGIMVVLLIIISVIFFSVVFEKMDRLQQRALDNASLADRWLLCLIYNGGTDRDACVPLAANLTVNETTVMAVLVLLSMNGLWSVLFLGRWSMVTGWVEFVRVKFLRTRGHGEFVSLDARFHSPAVTKPWAEEPATPTEGSEGGGHALQSDVKDTETGGGGGGGDYFSHPLREIRSPESAYSPPSAAAARSPGRLTHVGESSPEIAYAVMQRERELARRGGSSGGGGGGGGGTGLGVTTTPNSRSGSRSGTGPAREVSSKDTLAPRSR